MAGYEPGTGRSRAKGQTPVNPDTGSNFYPVSGDAGVKGFHLTRQAGGKP